MRPSDKKSSVVSDNQVTVRPMGFLLNDTFYYGAFVIFGRKEEKKTNYILINAQTLYLYFEIIFFLRP